MSPISDIYPSLTYEDAHAAIEFLCAAFGFQKRLVVPREDGGVLHSELSLGTSVVMVSSPKDGRRSPLELGGTSGGVSFHVDDPDAHFARAKAAGATVLRAPQDEDYGGRGYMVADPGGHWWYFGTYRPGAWWDGADGGAPPA